MGSVDRLVHNNGKIVFQGASALQGILINGTATSSVGLYDVEINSTAAADCSLMGAVDIYRNLTIIEGELSTHSTQNYALTVDGDCIVGNGSGSANTAILDGNASAISVGSLAIDTDGKYIATSGTTTITSERSDGFAINHDGNFVHSDGTVTVTTAATTKMDLNGTGNLYNLIINSSGHINQWDGNTTIDNDLTITAGTFQQYGFSDTLTVTGDVSVTGVLGHTSGTGAISMGSLTINSGGTYKSPANGTTTITKGTSTAGHSGQPSAIEVVSGGTFTHNSGTVLLSSAYDQDLEFDGTGNMYNLTINKSDNDVIHNSNLTIEGNLDITMGGVHSFRPNTGSRTVTVYGNTYLTGAGGARVGGVTQYTGTNSWGLVTINSGEFILSTGTNNVTGIRNIGGTISQS